MIISVCRLRLILLRLLELAVLLLHLGITHYLHILILAVLRLLAVAVVLVLLDPIRRAESR